MTSHSVSDYRSNCSNLLRDAVQRPAMYFRNLEELQAIINGHAMAYEELGIINRDEAFGRCFADWLRTTYNAPCSAGWSVALESLRSEDEKVNEVLARLIDEFLKRWNL